MNILIFSQHFWPEIFKLMRQLKELSKKIMFMLFLRGQIIITKIILICLNMV